MILISKVYFRSVMRYIFIDKPYRKSPIKAAVATDIKALARKQFITENGSRYMKDIKMFGGKDSTVFILIHFKQDLVKVFLLLPSF